MKMTEAELCIRPKLCLLEPETLQHGIIDATRSNQMIHNETDTNSTANALCRSCTCCNRMSGHVSKTVAQDKLLQQKACHVLLVLSACCCQTCMSPLATCQTLQGRCDHDTRQQSHPESSSRAGLACCSRKQ